MTLYVLLKTLVFILKVAIERLKVHNINRLLIFKLILGVVQNLLNYPLGEASLESVIFQIWPQIRRGQEKGDIRKWYKQGLATDLMRE